MPAMRATDRTSPLRIWFVAMRLGISGLEKVTVQTATAVRAEKGLWVMGTICAVLEEVRCGNLAELCFRSLPFGGVLVESC